MIWEISNVLFPRFLMSDVFYMSDTFIFLFAGCRAYHRKDFVILQPLQRDKCSFEGALFEARLFHVSLSYEQAREFAYEKLYIIFPLWRLVKSKSFLDMHSPTDRKMNGFAFIKDTTLIAGTQNIRNRTKSQNKCFAGYY